MDFKYVRAHVFGVRTVDTPTARPLTEAEIRWAYEDLPVTIETAPGVVTVTMTGAGPAYRYFAQRPADWTGPAPDAPHQHARTAGETVTGQHFARAAVPPF
ncbi:hypothetical protein [Streptomyces qinglanensis]|uniref:hypothetical protein n=1 Tax=Streptomyces qinglanensis TaxID=943816 RepID=UPI003D721547